MDLRPQKKVSSACSYCKLRKRKVQLPSGFGPPLMFRECSATLPCNNCVVNRQRCVYGEVVDGRRKEVIQRARLESNFHKEVLHRLLDKLRSGDDEKIKVLLSADASLEEIARHLGVPAICIPEGSSTRPGLRTEKYCPDTPERFEEELQQLSARYRRPYASPGYVELFGNLPVSASIPAAGYYAASQRHQMSNFRIPEYMIQPLHLAEGGGILTTLLNTFRDSCRRDLAAGISAEIVLGSEAVNLEVALRGLKDSDAWTPSTWACAIQQRFGGLDVCLRLACVYYIAMYMRWHIQPSAESYALMPKFMRPTLSQRLIPHHASIDIAHHPALRDFLVLNSQCSGQSGSEERPDITLIQVYGLRIAWESDVQEAITIDAATGYRTVSLPFIRAVEDVDKWQAGRAFLETFPQLQTELHFAEEDILSIDDRQLHELSWESQ